MLRIQKHCFRSMNMGHIEKNVVKKIIVFLGFYNGIPKFDPNLLIGYGDEKFF